MSESFRKYKVVETEGVSAEKLQATLNDATGGFPEMQIDHVVGTKIILGYESLLNAKGRAQMASANVGGVKEVRYDRERRGHDC